MREGKPNWLAVRHRLADLFPNDAGIENFICWLSIRLLPKDRQDVEAVVAILWDLFDKAETKDHPPAWFMGAVKQPVAKGGFAYRPIGRRRTSDV